MNNKYFIILTYINSRILEDDMLGFYKTITDYESIANVMDMNYSNPKRLRQEVRKLLNTVQETGYISYKILPQSQDIEIVTHITEPKSKTKKKNELYTCVPYNLMLLDIRKDLKMYFIALFRYSCHSGICEASNEQIALSSGLSVRKVQTLHKEAQKIGLIGEYTPSNGGYKYLGNGIKVGKMSLIPLMNEETGRYYYEDLLPKKKLLKKQRKIAQ